MTASTLTASTPTASTPTPSTPTPSTPGARGWWTLGRRLAAIFVAAAFILVASRVVAQVAQGRSNTATTDQLDRYDPALLASQDLLTALINQETGVRGFALSSDEQFLAPYQQGVADQKAATTELTKLIHRNPDLQRDLDAVTAAAADWQAQTADTRIAQVRAGDPTAAQTATNEGDKQRFDRIRSAQASLSAGISTARAAANERQHHANAVLTSALTGGAVLLLIIAAVIWVLLRRWVYQPLRDLGVETRKVAAGDFAHAVRPSGPPEVFQLGADVETMRIRITEELAEVNRARGRLSEQALALEQSNSALEQSNSALEQSNADLEQSNADLEQFAYVASHDLQEPLRKVSNFCQLLERQYGEQLDDRARQYIAFAVDGARRMQLLIQDLLGFSRVGRTTKGFVQVDLAAATARAVSSLEDRITEASAQVQIADDLPTVAGDESLLTTLMQNLVGNAVKYRGERTPQITVSVSGPENGLYTIAVTDNGIGIDATYADRIFIIFQRLHLRDEYSGTGIGLALCRKIVEYHGGEIWLDNSYTGGARFCFTIPDRSSA